MIRHNVKISEDLTLSILGGVGVSCQPQKVLESIEDYEKVEIALILRRCGSSSILVHPARLGVDGFEHLFGPPETHECVGEFSTWRDVERLITSLQVKALLPSGTKVEIL